MADSSPDLNNLSVQELTSLIRAAEAKRAEKAEEAKAALIAEMTERAAALGLSWDALVPCGAGQGPTRRRKPRSDVGKPVAAKYRGLDGQEWSGRGRPPAWLTAAEAGGQSREQFRLRS